MSAPTGRSQLEQPDAGGVKGLMDDQTDDDRLAQEVLQELKKGGGTEEQLAAARQAWAEGTAAGQAAGACDGEGGGTAAPASKVVSDEPTSLEAAPATEASAGTLPPRFRASKRGMKEHAD